MELGLDGNDPSPIASLVEDRPTTRVKMIGMTGAVILWKKGVKKSLEACDEVRAERAET